MPLPLKIQLFYWGIFLISLIPLFILYRTWFFFRNPKRKIPEGNNIVSPADGLVLYIKELKNGEMPISIKNNEIIKLGELIDSGYTDYNLVIGIFMTPFSIHYNRIPFSGKMVDSFYKKPGQNQSMMLGFLNLFFNIKPYDKDLVYIRENERAVSVIEGDGVKAAVVQIADKWVNKIKNDKFKGDDVVKGEQLGLIRMGSQCDIFLKIDKPFKVKVKEREYVKGGSTVLIEME